MNHQTDPFARLLKAAREGKGLSQRALSAMAGIPQAHISKIEKGAVDLRVSTLVALARALDLEPTLVPRNAVAAVQSIIRSSEPPVLPKASAAATKALQRLQKAVASIPATAETPQEFAQLARTVRDLRYFPLTPSQLAAVKEVSASVEAFKDLPGDTSPQAFRDFASKTKALEALRRALSRIQRVRNEVVHAPPPQRAEAVRPAYSLGDDEENDDS